MNNVTTLNNVQMIISIFLNTIEIMIILHFLAFNYIFKIFKRQANKFTFEDCNVLILKFIYNKSFLNICFFNKIHEIRERL